MKSVTIAVATAAVVFFFACGGSATSGKQARPLSEKQTQKLAEKQAKADAKAEAEYKAMSEQIEELRDIRVRLMGLSISCGLGVGEAETEADALNAATEAAREDLAQSVGIQIFRFSDTYVRGVPEVDRKKWDEAVKTMSTGHVRTTAPYKSLTLRNKEEKTYTVHTLLILDPVKFKDALSGASMGNEGFKSKARGDDLMRHMDAIITDFNSKYRKK